MRTPISQDVELGEAQIDPQVTQCSKHNKKNPKLKNPILGQTNGPSNSALATNLCPFFIRDQLLAQRVFITH